MNKIDRDITHLQQIKEDLRHFLHYLKCIEEKLSVKLSDVFYKFKEK
jgi:hypothetical protein